MSPNQMFASLVCALFVLAFGILVTALVIMGIRNPKDRT